MQSIVQKVYYSEEVFFKQPHFHNYHQIILVLKGNVELCVNGKTLSAGAGELILFSRYENHSLRILSEEYERCVLHIDPDVVNRKSIVYSLLTDRPANFSNIISVSPYMNEMISIFNKVLFEHNGEAKLASVMEQLLIEQLLIMVYRCTLEDFNITRDDVVIDLKRRFENNYSEQYSLNALAKQHNISVSSLAHRFKAATGVSIMDYLQFCRMANAKQMLVDTDNSIGEIVEKCGFVDNSNFSRSFKKSTGLSPSDFRKKYKAK